MRSERAACGMVFLGALLFGTVFGGALLSWALSAELAAASGDGTASPLGMGVCKPDCRSKTCGDNGCGGSCGRCPAGSGCHKNRCVKAPKGDPCVAMTGKWTGAMPATRRHPIAYIRGRIWGTAKACQARFHVSYRSRSGSQEAVIEYFKVTIGGTKSRRRAKLVCTRLTKVTSGASYSKDTFTGTLNVSLTRFRGTSRDTAGSTSPVYLNKK